jgi:hypothetical protein
MTSKTIATAAQAGQSNDQRGASHVGSGDLVSLLLRVLTTPSCWLQNNSYSRQWDRRLKELMATHRFVRTSRHTAMLGDVLIWIANHPYASFSPYGDREMEIRPSRLTIFRAHDKLMRDILG